MNIMRGTTLWVILGIGVLWLSSCGGKPATPLSEQAMQEALKDYFAQSQKMSVKVLDFRKTGEEKYHAETTEYYLIKFLAGIELPETDWGIIRKSIKGTLRFYKSGANWLLEDAQISTRNIGIKVLGVKPYFFAPSPIFGINCPYDQDHFIKIPANKCSGCAVNGREVGVAWAKTLKCLACQGTGVCPYCNTSPESLEETPMTKMCPVCNGTGQCSYCGGKYSELGLDTPGQDFGEPCKYCNGTGKCKYCHGTGIVCYYCSSSQKCPFCKGKGTFPREDFNEEGRLIKTEE